MIDKFKTIGFLECSTKQYPRISHKFSTYGNKELYKGFCFKDRHCRNKKENCNKAHIPNFLGLAKKDQDWLVNFVKGEKETRFVKEKGPKKTVIKQRN